MSALARSARISDIIQPEWQRCRAHVNSAAAARMLWDHRLTRPERAQLGDDFERAYRKGRTVGMWRDLHGGSYELAVIDLAKSLGVITGEHHAWLHLGLDESADPEEAKIDAAVQTGGLALVEKSRQAFWQRIKIPIDFFANSRMWDYLWELAECSRGGEWIDRFRFGNSHDPDFLTKRKSRLKGMPGFPLSLAQKIRSRTGGEQNLDLPSEMIWLIRS